MNSVSVVAKGLDPIVRVALRRCVLDAWAVWKTIPELDLWRVHRGSQITLELRRGVRSSIKMFKSLEPLETFRQLKEIAKEVAPDLGAWVGTATGGAALDMTHVVTNLVSQLDSSSDLPPESILDKLLDEIDEILLKRSVQMVVLAPLNNLILPAFDTPIELGRNVRVHVITNAERESLENHDALFGTPIPHLGIMNIALETEFTSKVDLGHNHFDHSLPEPDLYSDALNRIDAAHCALHSFTEGCAPVAFHIIRAKSSALPGLSGTRMQSGVGLKVGAYTLDASQLLPLKKFCNDVADAKRKELFLAVTRLRDAEMRRTPLDSLVDAFVGLEALLNPKTDGELSFRLALNFSVLGDRQSQFERFKSMRNLYSVRSKIVHGSAVGDTFRVGTETITLDDAARIARKHLRDVIHAFLNDSFLRGSKKLDFAYWEKRYFDEPNF